MVGRSLLVNYRIDLIFENTRFSPQWYILTTGEGAHENNAKKTRYKLNESVNSIALSIKSATGTYTSGLTEDKFSQLDF